MILHVVTAVTRPDNLTIVCESLVAATHEGWCDVVWHWMPDPDKRHVGGQKRKNDALNRITDGWVWFVDDDTVAHAAVPRMISDYDDEADVAAIVVAQARTDGRLLASGPEYARVGFIDIGQAIIRRSAIGDARIPEHYDGDGMFLEPLLATLDATQRVVWIPDVFSYHNAIPA